MSKHPNLFETIDISQYCNVPEGWMSQLHAPDRKTVGRLPGGNQSFRGVPFALVEESERNRWIWVSEEVTIPISSSASFIVFAHACPLASDEPEQPSEIEFMARVGEELARYVVTYSDGSRDAVPIRRRFEVSEWSSNLPPISFNSVSHSQFHETDWKGPHNRQAPVGWGPPGSSSMAGFPGVWATNQAGMSDDHSAEDPWLSLFVHRLSRPGVEIDSLTLLPGSSPDPMHRVLLGGMTLFRGHGSPLKLAPPRTFKITSIVKGADQVSVDVDLGVVGRMRPVAAKPADGWDGADFTGWGWRSHAEEALLVDVAAAEDATLRVGDQELGFTELIESPVNGSEIRIEVLPAALRNVEIEIVDDETGRRIPARVHLHAEDGRYLPPIGHRAQVNPGWMEDYDSSVLIGDATYAYVDGRFKVALPDVQIDCEIVKGFEYEPVRTSLTPPHDQRLEIRMRRPWDFSGSRWVTADTHVHFVSPTTALLEAQAEGVNLVHVLAIQVGNLFTNVADFSASPVIDESGETMVFMGSENRQPILGHISLLNTGRPITPLSTGGASTSHLGDIVEQLMADWADACHESGGFVVASHFPFPYGEITADIVTGRIDAVEIFGFGPGDLNPRIRDWYRFLNTGYRIPIVGGTDKMSAGTPIGAVRTYARLEDEVLSFDTWTKAVSSGRTFITSGPILELEVEGESPGGVIEMPSGGGSVAVRAEARSMSSIDALEVLVNGQVRARAEAGEGETQVAIESTLYIDRGSWVAARCTTGHVIWSAFPTAVAAHTSPVYIDCGGVGPWVEEDADRLGKMLLGGAEWLENIAVTANPEEKQRMAEFFKAAEQLFATRRTNRVK